MALKDGATGRAGCSDPDFVERVSHFSGTEPVDAIGRVEGQHGRLTIRLLTRATHDQGQLHPRGRHWAGSMGRALAEALLDAGHPTTVWNRTPAKAEPLVDKGAVHAETVRAAVESSLLIITCLTTFDDTRSALEPAAAVLAGRALVTLNSGSPAGARAMADWATGHDARFLAGAVKNVPSAVGLADTLLYYGGDRSVFDEHETTLKVLGGDTVHLGAEPDLAALYEMAVGAMLLPALVGFFQGAAVVQSRGLEVSSMVRYAEKWLDMIKSVLPVYAQEIDRGEYTDAASSVNLFLAGAAHDEDLAEEANVDTAWLAPLQELLQRAAEAGHGDHSISALTEVLRKPVRMAEFEPTS